MEKNTFSPFSIRKQCDLCDYILFVEGDRFAILEEKLEELTQDHLRQKHNGVKDNLF